MICSQRVSGVRPGQAIRKDFNPNSKKERQTRSHSRVLAREKSINSALGASDPGPLLYQGQGIGWDPEPSRERVGDWGGPEMVWPLLCLGARRATRPNGEWGYSTRRHMLGHERPGALSPGRGVLLADLQSSI